MLEDHVSKHVQNIFKNKKYIILPKNQKRKSK